MNRALNCSLQMAQDHMDELATQLISAGIFTKAEQQAPGIWTGDIDTTRYTKLHIVLPLLYLLIFKIH